MLRVTNLCCGYGKREVVRGVSLQVDASQTLAVLGPNGAGKSTLMKAIAWIRPPTAGQVTVDGRDVASMSRNQRARTIAYVPQRSSSVAVSAWEAVMLGRTPHFHFGPSRRDEEVVAHTIDRLGLQTLAQRTTTELSGGELQQVIIARALAQEPRLLLLDEPSNHLDIHNRLKVLSAIGNITKDFNIQTVIAIHDINTALSFADRFLFIHEGLSLCQGDHAVVTPEIIQQTFGLRAHVATWNDRPWVVFPQSLYLPGEVPCPSPAAAPHEDAHA